jgi:hypothetical protein
MLCTIKLNKKESVTLHTLNSDSLSKSPGSTTYRLCDLKQSKAFCALVFLPVKWSEKLANHLIGKLISTIHKALCGSLQVLSV